MRTLTALIWILIIWTLVNLCACAPTIRQCHIPVMVAASENTTDSEAQLLQQATQYWNETLEAPVFIYMGTIDAEPGAVIGRAMLVVGRPENYTAASELAVTLLQYDKNDGCIIAQWTELRYEAGDLDNAMTISLLRHELAHALGAYPAKKHRNMVGNLMSQKLAWAPPGGIPADDEEISYIKSLLPPIYRRKGKS